MAITDVVHANDNSLTLNAGVDPITFIRDGVVISNGAHYSCTTDTDFDKRRNFTVKVRMPVLDPKTRKYGKAKVSLSVVKPIELADGTIVFNTGRAEFEIHPSASEGNLSWLRTTVAMMVNSADMDDFWKFGTIN